MGLIEDILNFQEKKLAINKVLQKVGVKEYIIKNEKDGHDNDIVVFGFDISDPRFPKSVLPMEICVYPLFMRNGATNIKTSETPDNIKVKNEILNNFLKSLAQEL